jgi:hypothetical protein
LVNLHLIPHIFVAITCLFLFLLRFLFGMWTFSRIYSWVSSSCYDGASWCFCKSSLYFSSSESKMEMWRTCSLILASILGFLKLYLFKVSLKSLFFFIF